MSEPDLEAYDAGLLNDYGGGNVEWWQDYIRAELARAHDFYASQIAALSVEYWKRAHLEMVAELNAAFDEAPPKYQRPPAPGSHDTATVQLTGTEAKAAGLRLEPSPETLAELERQRRSVAPIPTILTGASAAPTIFPNMAHHQADALKIRFLSPEVACLFVMLAIALAGILSAVMIIK